MLLRNSYFAPRFLLPFVVPFLVWLGESINGLSIRPLRISLIGVALLVFVGAPLWDESTLYRSLTSQMGDYEGFIREVKKRTNPVSENCYSFSGNSDHVYFSRALHFPNESGKRDSICKRNYLLHSRYSWEGEHQVDPPRVGVYKELSRRDSSFSLYELVFMP